MSWRAGYMTLERMIRPTAQDCGGNGICFIESFLASLPTKRGSSLLCYVYFGPSHLVNDGSI